MRLLWHARVVKSKVYAIFLFSTNLAVHIQHSSQIKHIVQIAIYSVHLNRFKTQNTQIFSAMLWFSVRPLTNGYNFCVFPPPFQASAVYVVVALSQSLSAFCLHPSPAGLYTHHPGAELHDQLAVYSDCFGIWYIFFAFHEQICQENALMIYYK